MKVNDKQRALIDAYIELAQKESYDDNQTAEALLDIFDKEELVELGYGDYIKRIIYGVKYDEFDEVLVIEYKNAEEALEECYVVCADKDNALEIRDILQERIRI